LASDLTLVMNKLRQDSITNELLDLVGGQIAAEG
jgi:F0F1-type ATP synthase gamma subunit